MKLNPEELGQVTTLLHSVGWRKFEEYLGERLADLQRLELPDSVGSFFEREQQLGKVEVLRDLVSDFKQTVKQIESQNHE